MILLTTCANNPHDFRMWTPEASSRADHPNHAPGFFHCAGFFDDEEKARHIDSANTIACDDQLTPNLTQAFDEPVNSFRRDPRGLDIPGTNSAQLATADPYDLPP